MADYSLDKHTRPETPGGRHDATPAVCHQRHTGWVRRSSCRYDGRRAASLLGREPRTGGCLTLWPGDLRDDGGSVAAAGDGRAAGVDGTLRPVDRRGKEVRRVEHP